LKYSELPPWDLAVATLLSAILLILVFLSHESDLGPGAAIGFAIVFLLPGYSLTVTIFPGKSDLSFKGRLVYTIVFSVVLAAFAALILTFTPRGLNTASLAFTLSILALGLTIAAYLRWSALPKRKRHILGYDGRPKTLKRRRDQLTHSITLLFLGLIVIAAVSAFGFVANHNSEKQGMTELNIIKPEGLSAATVIDIVAGAPEEITAKIKNQEDRLVNYTLVLALNKSTLFSKEISLDPDQSWQGPASYAVNEPGDLKELGIFLYKEADFVKPYREANLLLNVSDNDANDLKIVNSSDKKSVVLDDEGRFVVMGDLSYGNGEEKVGPRHSSSDFTNPGIAKLSQDEIIEKASAASNQKSEVYSKNFSNSKVEDSSQMQPGPVDSQHKIIQTAPIIGIEINQLDETWNDDDTSVDAGTLRPILEVKGDKSGDPQQAGVAETSKKIELATEESLQVSSQNQDESKLTDMKVINSKDISLPSGQETKSSEEKTDDKSKSGVQDGAGPAKAQVGFVNSRPDSGSEQTDQEDKSKSSDTQPNAADPKVNGGPNVPAGDSDVKKPDGTNDKSEVKEEKQSEMEKEIDLWVDSHGVSASDKDGNSFVTKNIRYVKQGSGGKAVLGRSGKSYAATESNSQAINLS
jgi:uncharacterized membrane protein